MAIRFWWESWHIGKNESLGCFELNQVITRGIRNETDFMELWRAWNKKNPSGWIETTLTHHSQRVQQLRLWYEPRKIRNSLNGNLEHIDSAGRGLIIHVEG